MISLFFVLHAGASLTYCGQWCWKVTAPQRPTQDCEWGCYTVQEGGPRRWFSTFLLLVHIFFFFFLFRICKTLDGGSLSMSIDEERGKLPELVWIAALIEHRHLEWTLFHRDPLSRVPVGWRDRKLHVFLHDGREPSHRPGVFLSFPCGGKRDVPGDIYCLLCLRIANGGVTSFSPSSSNWLQDDGDNAVSFSEVARKLWTFRSQSPLIVACQPNTLRKRPPPSTRKRTPTELR